MAGSSNIRRLRHCLRRALSTPLCAERLSGLDVARLATVEDFQDMVPPLALDQLQARREAHGGDPFGGRKSEHGDPDLTVQMEYDPPLYIGLGRSELRTYAEALRRSWQTLGVGRGDRVALYDYGTSPAVYLASAAFVPYLSRGAAEALDCLPICNDGLPEMAVRAVHILRYFRPRVLFIRQDALRPFLDRIGREDASTASFGTEVVVWTANEESPEQKPEAQLEARLGVPVHSLVRADAALFLAPECPQGKCWHSWPDLYFLEVLDEDTLSPLPPGESGFLTVTPLFARTCPLLRYVTGVSAVIDPRRCPCGQSETRVFFP
jgi:phenylacetate-coenzyme A ligase PaaK-like adenylate-forming protein